jgi:hypothetical protein
VYRTTTRPIHKLVMIVPVEEQIAVSGLGETRTAEPNRQELLLMVEPKTEKAGSGKPPQAGDTPEDDPQNKRGSKEKLTQKVKHKKVNSRKKNGKADSHDSCRGSKRERRD